jgi:hypothetical protein
MPKMGAFGTIAIGIASTLFMPQKSMLEPVFYLAYIIRNLREICELQGRTIFLNQPIQVNIVKKQISLFYSKFTLGKIKCLID